MKDESSEARKAAAAAISLASPKRPMGMCTRRRAARSGSLAKSSWSNGVLTGPGHSAFDPHPLAGELHAELAGHGEDAALAGRVADLAGGRAHDRHEGGRVDDRTTAAGQKVRDPELAAQVDRRQVDLLDPLPGVDAGVEDGVVIGRADPGVVAADVDPPEALGHRLVQGLDRGGGRHVHLDEHAVDRLPPGLRRRPRRGRPPPPWPPRRRTARTWPGRCHWHHR